MPLITEQISNLINGVSQQPPTIRLASQCEEQINGLVTAAEGLKKRPPLEHITKMSSKIGTDAHVHWIDRDEDERFCVLTSQSSVTTGIDIVSLSGTAQTLVGVSGTPLTYLTTTNPRDKLDILTIADYSFYLNREKTPAKSGTTGAVRNPEGIIFLKQATSASTFDVLVDGVSRATGWQHSNATTSIDSLYTKLVASIGSTFTITKIAGSNVHITRINGADFTLHVQAPSSNAIGIKDSIIDFSDLPQSTKDGFTIKITGDPGSIDDDYWVKHTNSSDVDTGEWNETVEPGLANTVAPANMPHKLVKTGASQFTLSEVTWTDRVKGDLNTAPDPTFVGNPINGMFFHKNRFGFLSSENVMLSEIGEFFNFYSTTATDLLDTDPIDLAAPSNQVSILRNAIPFNEDMLLFSDFAQFRLSEFAAGGLTPANAKLSLLTSYEHDKEVAPVSNGSKIYFADTNDGFSVLREFGITLDQVQETAESITSHIPSYIEGSAFKIVEHDDFLFVLSDTDLNTVFVYKFLFVDGTKKLSSWSKWEFKTEEQVIGAHVFDHILYLTIVRADGTYLDKISLQDANLEGLTESVSQLPFKVLLDRLVTLTGVYDSGTDLTTWTLPYPDDNGSTFRVVLGPAWTGRGGDQVQGVLQPTSTTLTAPGDLSAGTVFIGKEYRFRYEFTEPTIKTEVAGRQTAIAGGVLKIRKFSVDYFNSGYFKMQVTANTRPAFSHVFTGRILGSALNLIGTIPFETGTFKKLILADSKKLKIELISDSYLPCAFTGANFEGNYAVRTFPRR